MAALSACAESNGPAGRVMLHPDSAVVAAHSTLALQPLFIGGRSEPLAWSSSDASVASVDSSGLVRARWPGAATIRAQSVGRAGLFATAAVTVTGPALRILPDSMDVASGWGWAQLRVEHSVLASPGYALHSTDSAIARVDSTGLVCPGRLGRTYIHARLLGSGPILEDSALVRVRSLPPPPLAPGIIEVLDSTGQPAGAQPVGGAITVRAIWSRWPCDRPDTLRVQLLVDSTLIASVRRGWLGTDSVAFRLDTRASDASGRRLVPDGSHWFRVWFLRDDGIALLQMATSASVANAGSSH